MEVTELEVTHFGFRQLPKVVLGGKSDEQRAQLICCTKYGQLIVGKGRDLAVFELKSFHDNYKNQKPTVTVSDSQPLKEVALPTNITHIGVSSDHNVLAVVDSNSLLLIDTRTLNTQPAVFTQAQLSGKCCGMMWNPGVPTVLATCTNGGEVTVWELRGDSLIQSKTQPTFGASSICWSSKGKQLAVGTKDGKIFNLKPTLDEARCTQVPPFLVGGGSVRDIFWISTFEYMAVYESPSGMKVVHVQNQKDKTVATKFTDYGDIFFCEPERDLSTLFCQLASWNTMILGCSRGMELAAIGAVPGYSGYYVYNLEDTSRAEMPYNSNVEPSFPTGMCVDYTYTNPTVINELTIPPTPVLLVLTSDNILCSYRLMNMEGKDVLTADSTTLPAPPPTRTKSLVNIDKSLSAPLFATPQAPTSTPTSLATPSFGQGGGLFGTSKAEVTPSFGLPASNSTGSLFNMTTPKSSTPTPDASLFVSPTPVLNQLSGPPKPLFAALDSAPSPLSFETPKLSLPAKPDFSLETPKTELPKPDLHKPELIMPKTPSSVRSEPAYQPGPQLNNLNKPLSKQEQQENQAAMDSIFAQSIEREIKQFTSQIEQHKTANLRMQDVNEIFNKEEIKERGNQSTNFENQLESIKATLENVNTNLQDEKDTLLVALASLEEARGSYACYKDPAYLALMRSKPLDKLTKKTRNDVHSKFAQMQQLVEELNMQLDKEWEDMHTGKRQTPSSRTIYKTLSQHRTISNSQEKLVDTLIKQISNLTMTPLSPPFPKVPTTASISPIKKKALKGFLDNYKPKSRTITSPAKLNISSYTNINKNLTKDISPRASLDYSRVDTPITNETNNNNNNTPFEDKPEQAKVGVPTLQYDERPKFGIEDPTHLIEPDTKCPSVVLQYRPAVPPVIQSREEKTRGAQELVTQFMAKIQQDGTPTGDNFSQQYVPVMRTKGPVAPGQAPNAVIQPVSSITQPIPSTAPSILNQTKTQSAISLFGQQATGSSPNPYLPTTSNNMFGITPISQPTNSPGTSQNILTTKPMAVKPSTPNDQPAFSFLGGNPTATPPPRTTPVIDARTISNLSTPPGAGVFAPVSTPPPHPGQIGPKSSPILVTPKSTTSSLFQPQAKQQFAEGGFPIVGSPVNSETRNSLSDTYGGDGPPDEEYPEYTSESSEPSTVDVTENEAHDEAHDGKKEGEVSSLMGNFGLGPASSTGSVSGNPFGTGSQKVSSRTATPNIFAQPTSTSLFASPAASPTPGLFGQATPSSSVGLFGVSATNSSIGLFAKTDSPSSIKSDKEKAPLTSTDPQPGLFATPPKEELFKAPKPKSPSPPTSSPSIISTTPAPTLASDTVTSTPSNPLGSLFGALSTGTSPTPAVVAGLFGSTSTGALFSTNSTTPASTGGLLGTPASTGGSLFGTTTSSNGLFTSTTTTPASGGLFGTASSGSGGLFVTSSASTPGLFGSSTSTPALSGFNFASKDTTPDVGQFGATSTTPASGGVFGQSGGGPFATNTSGSSGALFGTATNTSTFGQSSITSSGFGPQVSSGFSTQPQLATPGFGTQPQPANPAFGGTTAPLFGTAPAFGGNTGFGSAPAFGTAPAFGSGPAFGGGASFGAAPAAVFGSGSTAAGGTVFGSNSESSSRGVTFGAIAQNPTGFGALSAQPAPSFGTAGGGGGGFLNNTANNTNNNSFGNSSSSFSSWR